MWSDCFVFCDCGSQSVCPLMEKDKRLMEASYGRDWLRGKLGLVLMGGAVLSKSLIQFSVDGWGCVPSCCLTWGRTMVELMKIMETSFQRSVQALLHSVPPTLQQANMTHACTGDSWTLTGKSWSVSCGVTAPFSWVLVCPRFCLCPPQVCFPCPV